MFAAHDRLRKLSVHLRHNVNTSPHLKTAPPHGHGTHTLPPWLTYLAQKISQIYRNCTPLYSLLFFYTLYRSKFSTAIFLCSVCTLRGAFSAPIGSIPRSESVRNKSRISSSRLRTKLEAKHLQNIQPERSKTRCRRISASHRSGP